MVEIALILVLSGGGSGSLTDVIYRPGLRSWSYVLDFNNMTLRGFIYN